ncbi:O-antigen ligase family protein [Falsiroseomonas sp.]|uniref:O-antigen ligase family protein n=1 Tax=Falsiroseomonas sp. TaxID=2870721 RepID=UPI003F6ED581
MKAEVMPWRRSAATPVAVLLAVAPAMAVLQFRTMALAVTLALLAAVVTHRLARGAWPWPRMNPVAWLAVALLGWCGVAALWSPEPVRALQTIGGLAALLGLALMTARALAEEAAGRRLAFALAGGLALGLALAALDHATGNWLRLAVRGFPEMPAISFGLKPAVSLMVLLLPLVVAVPMAWALRAVLLAAGLAVALWLPADSAKIAAVAGLVAAGAVALLPRAAPRLAALAFAAFSLAAPLVFAFGLSQAPSLEPIPRSAAHRVLIWDFVVDRIAEKPLLGWGMESSRAIPGGSDTFGVETLDRYGLNSPEARHWFGLPSARRLPLHTHNAALQIWLELGLVGALLGAALGAAALLAAGASPAGFGMAVSAVVTGQLSFGVWQPWWVASVLLAAVVAGALRKT